MNPGEIENEIAAIEAQLQIIRESDRTLGERIELTRRLCAQIEQLRKDKEALLR